EVRGGWVREWQGEPGPAFAVTGARRSSSRGRTNPCGDAVAEPARAEMHADPDVVILIGEHVDVVVARANRAELLTGLGTQAVALVPVRHGVPRGILEQRIARRRVAGAILQADAERQRGLNLIGELAQPSLQLRQRHVGADRGVAAGDVE